MASELIQGPLNHPLFGNSGQAPDVKSWARGVCVGSPMLDKIWSEDVFISGRHPSSYKLVCKVGYGPTQVLRVSFKWN